VLRTITTTPAGLIFQWLFSVALLIFVAKFAPFGSAIILVLSILVVFASSRSPVNVALPARSGKIEAGAEPHDRVVLKASNTQRFVELTLLLAASLITIPVVFPGNARLALVGLITSDALQLNSVQSLAASWVLGGILLVLFIAAFKKLSLTLIGLSVFFASKEGIAIEPSDLHVSSTDWFLPWLALSSCISIFVLMRSSGRVPDSFALWEPTKVRLLLVGSLALVISSYFWSGVKKLFLGEFPFDWALNNQTQFLVGNAEALQLVPLIGSPDSLPWEMTTTLVSVGIVVVFLNFFTLFIQLASPLALSSRKMGLTILLFIELEHVGVFLLTGILFWKWMVVTTAFGLAAARLLTDKPFEHRGFFGKIEWQNPQYFSTLTAVCVVLFAAPVFPLPQLGWWDSPLMIRVERVATVAEFGTSSTSASRELIVPPSFWTYRSLPVAQSRNFPSLSFLPRDLQNNRALGAVQTKALSDYATAYCSNLQSASHPPLLRLGENFSSGDEVMETLRMSPFSENLGLSFLYPHHIYTGLRAHTEWLGVKGSDIQSIRSELVLTCMGRGLDLDGESRIPIVD
jgi:hypothetical protein